MDRQYRLGTRSIDYELCTVTIEKSESPLEATQCELLEKTGYAGGEWELNCLSTPNPAVMTNNTFSFLAKGVKDIDQRHLENTEKIEIHLLTYEELKTIVKESRILQGQLLAPLWKYIAENQ